METCNNNDFLRNGYVIISQLIDRNFIGNLQNAIADYRETSSTYGIRDLHHKIAEIDNLTLSPLILKILEQYTKDRQFQLIKAIFFNKNLNQNWAVSWHQDKTIAVREKIELPNFKNWTVKQNVPHVQPPLSILEKIATIRIALDDTDGKNGALKIIPQSHQLGILERQQIERIIKLQTPLICSLKAGDALLMHPLTLHSSSKSISDRERGTIHLEYSSCDLPQNLAWYN